MKYILGTKLAMTQVHDEKGAVKPVTLLSVGPCIVTQVKTHTKDGYNAIQFGFGEKRSLSRALRGHMKGAFMGKDGRGFKFLKEARVKTVDGIERGSSIDVSSFTIGDTVQVTAWSKGRGFTGVVKRHHFHGHPTTHGHKDQTRMPGSIGAGGNQHVFKGLRMAGRMGNEQVTVKNLEVVAIDSEKGILTIKGAVPGSRNGLVIIRGDGEMIFKNTSDQTEAPGEEKKEDTGQLDESRITDNESRKEEVVSESLSNSST